MCQILLCTLSNLFDLINLTKLIWLCIISGFRLSFMYPPTKKNNDQYPTMLFLQLLLSNTLRNLEFTHLKFFKILLPFKINSRFHDALQFPDFFLIIETTKYFTLKQWNQICGKRHHLCEIRCPILTPKQLSIAGVIKVACRARVVYIKD